MVNSFGLYISESVFQLPSFLNDNLVGHKRAVILLYHSEAATSGLCKSDLVKLSFLFR